MLNSSPLTQPSISTLRQLFYLVLISFGCLLAGVIVSDLLINVIYGFDFFEEMLNKTGIHPAGYLNAFRLYLGLGNTVMGFLAPALLFAFLTVRQPDAYLRYRTRFPALLLVLVILFMIFFMPVIEITAYYNQNLSLPGGLKKLEDWIRSSESANEAMLKQVLVVKTPTDLAISIFLVAILPAIAEEFLFRGCLQSILQRSGLDMHVAVWTAAFIFSFIHLAFLGFVPRMLLGAALGYFFVYSGSIWPSVFAHFLNNAFAVVQYYWYQKKGISTELDKNAVGPAQLAVCIVCLALATLIMIYFQRYATKHRLANGKELD